MADNKALGNQGLQKYTEYIRTLADATYLQANVLELVYPVGSIYMSTVGTLPTVLTSFGTWTQIKDVFLLAAGDTYTAGDTGGQATITYTPAGSNSATALSVSQMPAHTHYVLRNSGPSGSSTADNWTSYPYIAKYATTSRTDLPYSLRSSSNEANIAKTSDTGSGDTHNHTWTGTQATLNNMPPYKVVYAWERTA